MGLFIGYWVLGIGLVLGKLHMLLASACVPTRGLFSPRETRPRIVGDITLSKKCPTPPAQVLGGSHPGSLAQVLARIPSPGPAEGPWPGSGALAQVTVPALTKD